MKEITDKERAALEVLKSTGKDVLEAAMVAKKALEAGHGRVKRTMRCLAAGEEELRRQEKTVSFAKAVEAALEARAHKRSRTQSDFRYITRRFMKRCPGLAARRIRSITPQECASYIEAAFDTPRQRQKGRLILSGVFSTARKRGWCSDNPVTQVDAPVVIEQPIPILQPEEISTLLRTAEEYEGGKCLPAVGLMLYAGIRPHEVTRLRWAQVNLQEHCICIPPQHSKTGGARHVTIYPPLTPILQARRQAPEHLICPPQWPKHWRRVRRQAGWQRHTCPWPQDVLRHTFASYHAAHFRNLPALQLEMGHRDSSLLRTRYLYTAQTQKAELFWTTRAFQIVEWHISR